MATGTVLLSVGLDVFQRLGGLGRIDDDLVILVGEIAAVRGSKGIGAAAAQGFAAEAAEAIIMRVR
jgi:hypothetical protein